GRTVGGVDSFSMRSTGFPQGVGLPRLWGAGESVWAEARPPQPPVGVLARACGRRVECAQGGASAFVMVARSVAGRFSTEMGHSTTGRTRNPADNGGRTGVDFRFFARQAPVGRRIANVMGFAQPMTACFC